MFENIKVGDTVALKVDWYSMGWGSSYPIYKPYPVQKVTEREITVDGRRFLRRNGKRVGGYEYSSTDPRIEKWTPELEKRIAEYTVLITEDKERRELMKVIEATEFKRLDLEKLRAVVEILKAH